MPTITPLSSIIGKGKSTQPTQTISPRTGKPIIPLSQIVAQNKSKDTKDIIKNNIIGVGQSIMDVAKPGAAIASGVGKGVDFISGLFGKKTGLGDTAQRGSKQLEDITTSKNPAQEVGHVTGDIAQFFIPAGVEKSVIEKGTSLLPKLGEIFTDSAGNLSKVGKAAEYGIKALVHATSGGAVTTAQTGDIKQGLETGSIIGLADTPIALGAKFLGGILKNAASFVSGKGRDVINEIVSDPNAALKGISEDTAKGLNASVTAIKKFASDTYTAVKDRYAKGLADIEKKYLPSNAPFMKQGVNLITPKDTIGITLKGVKDKVTSVFNSFGVDGDFTKGFNFNNSPTDALKRPLTNIFNKIKGFTDITPTGINNLVQSLTDVAQKTRDPQAISVASQIASNLRTYLGERIPEIKVLNADYTKVSKFLEDMDTALSTGVKGDIKGGMTTLEGMIDTGKKLANIFGKDAEQAREFIKSIPGGSKWIAEQAGRTIAEGQKLSGFAGGGGMFKRALESAIPPKLTGVVTAKVAQLAPMLAKLAPAEQGIIKELFQAWVDSQSSQDTSSAPSSGVGQRNQGQ